MTNNKLLLIIAGIVIFFISCNDEFEQDKYKRPDWLAGKLYTQIKDKTTLSLFARCIERTGYDTIINTSGSYTVFAPDDNAFSLYFQSHPQYTSVEDIPIEELSRIVKYHIIQNPWSREQLRSLDVYGWIDTLDINNDQPAGFKRETLLRETDQKYGVATDADNNFKIVDTLLSPWYRRNYTDSRKYAPVFYQDYLDIYDLTSDDYEFYFGRPFDSPADMYYMGGKITEGDIFAENGFIHVIDRVIEPLQNASQILSTEVGENSYSKFFDLVNYFPEFTYNEERTFDQPGAELGYEVDSLFDISYPDLAFDIINEKTKAPKGTIGLPSNVSIRYHHGLVAPTNEALDAFENEYFVGGFQWGSIRNAPRHLKRMIVNTYMSTYPIYPKDFADGFMNGESDIVSLDQSSVVQQQYGSNCTFIGVDQAIVPRAFSSVTGPVYLNRGYSYAMYAIERAGLISTLKKADRDYLLFVESDVNCQDDSSLLYNIYTEIFSGFLISGQSAQRVNFSTNDLRILLMNHIGTAIPKKIARKEFIPNLAGNFIIFNNETGEVSGNVQTTVGYKGSKPVVVIPNQISTNADNGFTYDISNWFGFSASSILIKLQTSFPAFFSLLQQAGLATSSKITFISDNENYTVFAPSAAALAAYNTDTLTTDELKKFLMMHFVQGTLMFTDGNLSSGYYETTRIDEKSTSFATIFTKVYIDPGIDLITFPDKSSNPYLEVSESAVTNIITGRTLSDEQFNFPNIVSNGVIHEIDKVLLFDMLDTQ
ncbi:MAG: fasciclin domain-containing protein [Bacteroidales bacterium]|nr:fasciclin domain-containing protein [Bacteroidales bacterium]